MFGRIFINIRIYYIFICKILIIFIWMIRNSNFIKITNCPKKCIDFLDVCDIMQVRRMVELYPGGVNYVRCIFR